MEVGVRDDGDTAKRFCAEVTLQHVETLVAHLLASARCQRATPAGYGLWAVFALAGLVSWRASLDLILVIRLRDRDFLPAAQGREDAGALLKAN
jgi:hypothetical protein